MINYENSLLINYVAALQGTSEQAHPVWIYFRCSRVIFLLSFCRSVIPNCQFRSKTSRLKTFTANQLDEIKDPSGLFYILPFQKVREFHLMKSRWFLLRGSFSFCLGHFLYRVIWSTGTSRGKCGTICLERKCLRFRVCFIFLSFVSFLNHIVWSHCLLISSDLTIPLLFWVQVDFADTSVVITEPYFNFSSIQESMNEILFEEYQFQSALRINGESMLDKHGVGPRFLLLLLSFTANSY